MALTAQQVYNQSLGLQRNRTSQMYGRNLEMLARQMRDASEGLEANLEGRGVLRSGEANTARSRLKQNEALQRRYLTEDRDYSMSQLNLDEQARRASQAGSGGGRDPSMMPVTGGRSAEDIYASFQLEKGRQASVATGDSFGVNTRKRFNIPTRGTRP
jgi:hypothetical protein